MRLLPIGADHERGGAAARKSETDRQRHRRSYVRQYLPLRHLSENSPRDSPCRGDGRGKEVVMSAETMVKRGVGRRDFLKTGATLTGGLVIAAYVPELAAGTPEA